MTDDRNITVVPHASSGHSHTREVRDVHDGIVALRIQHDEIRSLLDEVGDSRGGQRRAAFDALRELLARHETAEEMVLRPLSRSKVSDEVADARMREENDAKETLAHLESLDVESAEFDREFSTFAADVRAHADAEESEEFSGLADSLGDHERARLADAVRTAERTAPTHPHPSADTTAKNYVTGPFAAMADRARDAIGKLTS